MRSSEIAQLAGVTVRALRHYHALGLLPEPERGENGYRNYGAHDLVTLLRIKRLASLGFSLECIDGMLEAEDEASAGDELAALDRELALRIADLERQRVSIAKLRAQGVRGHVPPEHARFIGALAGCTDNRELVELDVDSVLLADAVLPPEVGRFLSSYHDAVLAQGSIGEYAALNERFMALDQTTPRCDQDTLVADFADYLTPLMVRSVDGLPLADLLISDCVFELMLDFDAATLNEVQRSVSDRVTEAVGRRMVEAGAIDAAMAEKCGISLDPDVAL